MAKHASKFYSVAVNHPELPGAYLASFAMPGHAPEWVMDGRVQKIFITPESAEIAGFRAMMARMNFASQAQNFSMKNPDKIRVSRPAPSQTKMIESVRSKADAVRVFSRFKDGDKE